MREYSLSYNIFILPSIMLNDVEDEKQQNAIYDNIY